MNTLLALNAFETTVGVGLFVSLGLCIYLLWITRDL